MTSQEHDEPYIYQHLPSPLYVLDLSQRLWAIAGVLPFEFGGPNITIEGLTHREAVLVLEAMERAAKERREEEDSDE